MRKLGLLVIGLGLAFVACIGAAAADKLEISPTTYENYQDYLKKIGGFSVAVFAVSLDGRGSYYVYCEENCSMSSLAKQAVEECARVSDHECKVMAVNRDLRVEFEVFSESKDLSSDDEILAHRLSAEDLKTAVAGNTIRGEYPNGAKFVEFYDPSGEIRGHDEKNGDYTAKFALKKDQLCFDYPGSDGDWCAQISKGNGQVYFIDGGKLVTFIRRAEMVSGNPDNL